MDFKVRPASVYASGCSHYYFPLEIGCFSENYENEYADDNHQMKYLVMPKKLTHLHWDLNEGYEDFIEKCERGHDFDHFLKWILCHEEQVKKYFTDVSDEPAPDFIFYRGLLTKVGSTVYEKSDDWMLHASKFRSVIYLQEIETEYRVERDRRLGEEKAHRFTTYGFKFEQFMTSDTIGLQPNTSIPVNENEKYFTVMKGKLDNHTLLLSAEVDGVYSTRDKDSDEDLESDFQYVELKTSRLITSCIQKIKFLRYKLIKWYLQSYFAGIHRIICGFRDDDGIVRELGIFNVRDMPKMAEDLWSPSVCLNFCSEFFNFVKKCVVKDNPKVVYEFYWKPGCNITCEELPTDEERFLPDWYTECVEVI